MELKKVRNLTNREQFVVYKGKQILLPAGESLDMDVRVADLFLERCEGAVEEVIDIGGVYTIDNSDDVWVANVTGNPDAPPEVQVKRSDKGRWYSVAVPNPNKAPRDISRQLKRGMKEVMGRSGVEALNLLPKTVKVPKYKRIKMPKGIARWFLNRVTMSGTGDCMKSRAPAAFEPDDTWALDDLNRYLQLVDSSAHKGPTEWKLRSVKRGSGPNGKALTDRAIRDAKEMVLKRIYFRVVDPKFRLPNRQEFEEFRAAEKGELKEEPEGGDPEDLTAQAPEAPPATQPSL